MTKDEGSPNDKSENRIEITEQSFVIRASSFIRHSSFELRHFQLSPRERDARASLSIFALRSASRLIRRRELRFLAAMRPAHFAGPAPFDFQSRSARRAGLRAPACRWRESRSGHRLPALAQVSGTITKP